MSTDGSSFARASLRDVRAYAGAATAAPIDLSDNTNRWGSPPSAVKAISGATDGLASYPDAYSATLKKALAGYVGAPESMIATGCGSDDLLDAVTRAFADPGDTLAAIDPTFVMVPAFARINGLVHVPVPLLPSYDADVDAIAAADARIVYLCSPNNPTGTVLRAEPVRQIVSGARGVVVIDEAYAEFAPFDFLSLARERENVVIVRTLSKAFGLAGLRVGYAVGAPSLIREIEKCRGPFKISTTAEAAAAAAVSNDVEWVSHHAALAREARNRLAAELRDRGLDALPSAANFVLVPIEGARGIATRMREQGVAVRPFVGLPPISPPLAASGGAALRISVGPHEEIEAMLTAFDRARS